MLINELTHQRLLNQQIAQQAWATPADLVRWMGAIQAQDYLGALWAVGLRMPSASEQAVEQALAARAIVRTWPMRGTIHFIAPEDAHWMLALLTPRLLPGINRRLGQLGIDERTIGVSAEVVAKALAGGRQLTRPALYALLEQAGIATGASRGLHILGRLAHDRLLCFGARAGKQPTYTLLDEWVPPTPPLPRDVALATLAQRYIASHGPATLHDLAWWSGLPIGDARAALGQAVGLAHEQIGGVEHFYSQHQPAAQPDRHAAHLLPPYDEYLVGYRERGAMLDPQYSQQVVPGANGIFHPIVVIDGQVAGTWRRELRKHSVAISSSPFTTFSTAQLQAIAATVKRYGRFVGRAAVIEGG